MNPHLEKRLQAILGQLQAVHGGGEGVSTATRGGEREAFVDLLLRGCLPDTFRFGSGDVTDAHGNKSGQLDLVIEYPFYPSFPLLGTSQHRLYLLESVALAIEVKSGTSKWSEAIETMKKVRALVFNADWPKDQPPSPFASAVAGTGLRAFTCFPGHLGFAIVVYNGWANAETLRKHCDVDDVDVALQITPPIFYARNYRVTTDSTQSNPKTVEGCEALAAFLFALCDELRMLADVNTNVFRRYVENCPPTVVAEP